MRRQCTELLTPILMIMGRFLVTIQPCECLTFVCFSSIPCLCPLTQSLVAEISSVKTMLQATLKFGSAGKCRGHLFWLAAVVLGGRENTHRPYTVFRTEMAMNHLKAEKHHRPRMSEAHMSMCDEISSVTKCAVAMPPVL